MPSLFDPFTIKSITLRNRIGVSPMCQYSSTDGLPSAWHLVHLGSRAVGGASLVIQEATGVLPEGRITPGCAGLWNDAQAEAYKPINAFIASQGAVPGIQIAHAGRKSSAALPKDGGGSLSDAQGGWETFGPSAIAFGGELTRVPTAMTLADIARVQAAFVAAAKRSLAAGFKWLEIHAAHGYLAHEFLSPLSNQRTDQYGGSFENRIRFLLETIRAVRAAWPQDLPLTVRISATDWTPGGWTDDDSVELSRRLKAEGVDLVDCSTGGNVNQASIPVGPGYQVRFAERIKKEAAIATAAVGMITEAHQAEAIIQAGKADIVLLAREMLRDPYWALHASRALGHKPPQRAPIQYGRAL